jgi:hypothetical protein
VTVAPLYRIQHCLAKSRATLVERLGSNLVPDSEDRHVTRAFATPSCSRRDSTMDNGARGAHHQHDMRSANSN